MRDKLYLYITAGIFFALFIICPATFFLEKLGVIEIKDLANYKDPEKIYYFDTDEKTVKTAGFSDVPDEYKDVESALIPAGSRLYMNTLNGIEEGKASIETVYTNYLPFYADMLSVLNSEDNALQDEFVLMLFNRENSKKIKNTPAEKSTDSLADGDSDTKEPEAPQLPQFIASKITDWDMFRVYRVRSADDSIGFLDISMAMDYETANINMRTEADSVIRIASANQNVNFFVYLATRMQDTEYYNLINPHEPSTKNIFDKFVAAVEEHVDGIAWLDIDTFEKRMKLLYKTDHHWNARGAYQGYTDMINMMNKVIPEIGDPIPLNTDNGNDGFILFPKVQFRGMMAEKTNTPTYYDEFEVMDITLPRQHSTEKISTRFNEYSRGAYDADKLPPNDYTGHYGNYFIEPQSVPFTLTYPDNRTGRKLLLITDSYSHMVSWLIAANFDKTFVYYTHYGRSLNYNNFIADNGVTDVLLLQYSARTLSRATSADAYLNQIITK